MDWWLTKRCLRRGECNCADPKERSRPRWRCCVMADQALIANSASTADTVAQIIAQCRRDIEAAWAHVEAARQVLRRSRWLYEHWKQQLADSHSIVPEAHVRQRPRSVGFVMIPGGRAGHSRRRLASVS